MKNTDSTIKHKGERMAGKPPMYRLFCALAVASILFPAIARESEAQSETVRSKKKSAGENVLEKKTLQRFYDPVEIRAGILTGLLGAELGKLRLYNFANGSFHSIPFQFDEWTAEGSMILDHGAEENAQQGNGTLDPNDMLVFMARETGDRVPPEHRPDGAGQGIEIEIVDPLTNTKGWAYLLPVSEPVSEAESPPLSSVDQAEKYIAQGATYTIVGTNHVRGKKTYKTVVNEHVWVKKEAGGDGEDFIDRSKFRVSARMLFGTIRIGFDEDDFIGEVSKFKLGPVRSVARQWACITMPLGLKSPRLYGDVYVYDTLILIVFETKITMNPKYLLTDYRMIIGYDLNPAKGYGMQWYNSNNPDGFLVDGITSPQEASMVDELDQWRCIVGPTGWMLHRSMWDDFYRSQADIRIRYRDDVQHRDPPDYYPGDLGYYYVESKVSSLKPRKYTFQLEWYWPYDFYNEETLRADVIKQIMNIRDHPLQVRVGDRDAASTGGQASLVDP